ncbi:response regulator [Methylobacterium sp. WL9]|uniref:response regulator n=1 Tax=Methylobacterium sp. WL9 TaxID=2603898 RepID=UPI0011CA7616|nr:response regulator [Methylobacterium sp. WL9]TXN21822.1 response regulator [Methylobacterium sp. WL9]
MTDHRSMPVLVVDDVPAVVAVVRAVLGQIGFPDVDEAADGTAALAAMTERRYGLVISDWNMSPMTGYELLRRVRADESLRETPFVMMTTPTQAENFVRARQAGVNRCLLKPFSPAALRTAIEGLCGTASSPRANSAAFLL